MGALGIAGEDAQQRSQDGWVSGGSASHPGGQCGLRGREDSIELNEVKGVGGGNYWIMGPYRS